MKAFGYVDTKHECRHWDVNAPLGSIHNCTCGLTYEVVGFVEREGRSSKVADWQPLVSV